MLVEAPAQEAPKTPGEANGSNVEDMQIDDPSSSASNQKNSCSSNDGSSAGAAVSAEDLEGDDDPDDPIVQVLDVYLRRFDDVLECSSSSSSSGSAAAATAGAAAESSGGSNSKVFVLQFPLRPQGRPYGDQGQLQQVAYRQQQQQLRLSYSLHNEGPNFDRNHPLAAAATTSALGVSPAATAGAAAAGMTHVLKSQVAKGGECSYAVGLVRDGALYLTPVQGVLQFKPDFGAFEALQQQQQLLSSNRRLQQGQANGEGSSPSVAGAAISPSNASGAASPQDAATAGKGTAGDAAAAAGGQQQQQQQLIQQVGETRTRISHSRQRDIEESEPWIPIEVNPKP